MSGEHARRPWARLGLVYGAGMGILGWILLGLFVGAISRALVPGPTEPGGCIGTTAVGILGALIGGFIASALGLGKIKHFFDLETWLVAIGGSVLLLLLLRAISGPRRPVR